MLNGTGFFVSDDGKFITNRHVAITDIDQAQLKANLATILRATLMQCAMSARQVLSKYNMLEAQKSQYMEYDFFGNIIAGDEGQLAQIVAEQNRLKKIYEQLSLEHEKILIEIIFNGEIITDSLKQHLQ